MAKVKSVLCKDDQRKVLSKEFVEAGKTYKVVAEVRYGDSCGNRHNTFSVTGTLYRKNDIGWRTEVCGCIHDDIFKHFPELAKFIKWHLTSTDGPLHYVANSMYWAKQGNLEYARKCAVWPNANLEDFTKEKLMARKGGLMRCFRAAVAHFGFTY